jgi:hypothetical protein
MTTYSVIIEDVPVQQQNNMGVKPKTLESVEQIEADSLDEAWAQAKLNWPNVNQEGYTLQIADIQEGVITKESLMPPPPVKQPPKEEKQSKGKADS